MSYVKPAELATRIIDAGESKVFMSTRDTLIRAYMAGAILALAAALRSPSRRRRGSRYWGRCCSRSASACCTCSDSIC